MEMDEKKKNCKVCLSILFVGILSIFALVGQVLQVIEKVRTGHGLDYFITMWGYQFNYIGALVGFIAIALLCIISPIIYWVGSKEERSFKRKYGINGK